MWSDLESVQACQSRESLPPRPALNRKAKMTQRSMLDETKTNGMLPPKVCCLPKGSNKKKKTAANAKNKNTALRNLMIHETKSCLQHQRLLNTHDSQWGHLCLFSLVIYTSGRWQTIANLAAKVSSLIYLGMTPNNRTIIVSFYKYWKAVQSHPVCLVWSFSCSAALYSVSVLMQNIDSSINSEVMWGLRDLYDIFYSLHLLCGCIWGPE